MIAKINNNVNFTSVTPIVASKKAGRVFDELLTSSDIQYERCDFTEYYKNKDDSKNQTTSALHKAAQKGKKIFLLLSGSDIYSYLTSARGWKGEFSPARHINQDIVTLNADSFKAMKKLIEKCESDESEIHKYEYSYDNEEHFSYSDAVALKKNIFA